MPCRNLHTWQATNILVREAMTTWKHSWGMEIMRGTWKIGATACEVSMTRYTKRHGQHVEKRGPTRTEVHIAMLGEMFVGKHTPHPNGSALPESAPNSTCGSSQTSVQTATPFGRSWDLLPHTSLRGLRAMTEHPSSEELWQNCEWLPTCLTLSLSKQWLHSNEQHPWLVESCQLGSQSGFERHADTQSLPGRWNHCSPAHVCKTPFHWSSATREQRH